MKRTIVATYVEANTQKSDRHHYALGPDPDDSIQPTK